MALLGRLEKTSSHSYKKPCQKLLPLVNYTSIKKKSPKAALKRGKIYNLKYLENITDTKR